MPKRETLEQKNVEELREQASKKDVEGRSQMNKEELVDALSGEQSGQTDSGSEQRDASKLDFNPQEFAEQQAKLAQQRQKDFEKSLGEGALVQDLPGAGAREIPSENRLPISGGFVASDADKGDEGFSNEVFAAAQAQVDEDTLAAYAHDASLVGGTGDQVNLGTHVERGVDDRLHQRSQLRTDFGS